MHLDGEVTVSDPPPPALRELEDERAWLERILGVLRAHTGLDFRGYRPGMLLRRVRNRMISAGEPSLPAYLDRLRAVPGEADALVERLTIKVSRFYRGAACFEALQRALEARRASGGGGPLLVWSAGCGHGEEAYSLAMLLAELGQPPAISDVLATDIDPAALSRARRGLYGEAALEELPPPLRARWLEAEPGAPGGAAAWRVRPELRARIDFRRHDLAGSACAPSGRRFDLVSCRNVLIYLDGPLRGRVEALLVDSLLDGGLLCLGEAEWPGPAVAGRLEVVDRKARIFRLRERGARGGTG